MRSLCIASVVLGVVGSVFGTAAYGAFGPVHPDGHHGAVFVPEQSHHLDNFHYHAERQEREAWRLPQARGRVCGHQWGCRH